MESTLQTIAPKKRGERDTIRPIVVDEFMSPMEAQILLERYKPLLHDSLHYNDRVGSVVQSRYRTSRSVRLPPLGDDLVFDIEQRAASMAGRSTGNTDGDTSKRKFNHSLVEDFQLACYGRDQLYGLHRDDNDLSDRAATADRAATVLIYLQQPQRGGETIFTRKPIEEERDLDTKQPLRTEAGALKLFQRYCDKPRKQFTVVRPQTGRAVTWENWYGPNMEIFAKDSTHGACPVQQGEKCVIQQWISKTNKLPLRDERVEAIFPCGADISYRKVLDANKIHNDNDDDDDHDDNNNNNNNHHCMRDVSTKQGAYTAQLCFIQKEQSKDRYTTSKAKEESLRNERQGPYVGVGAIGVTMGLTTVLPEFLLNGKDDLTISFWANHITNDTTLVSFGDRISVTMKQVSEEDTPKWTLVLSDKWNPTTEQQCLHLYTPNQWLWYSFSLDSRESMVHFSIVSKRGDILGNSQLKVRPIDGRLLSNSILKLLIAHFVGQSQSSDAMHNTFVSPQQLAFVSDGGKYSNVVEASVPSERNEISFVVLHSALLSEREMKALRLQIERYNRDK